MRNNWDDLILDFPFLQAAYHCQIYHWAPIFSITVRRLWFTLFDTVNLCYVNSVTSLSLNCTCTIPEGLALAFPTVLWKAMVDRRDSVKRWGLILDVWQEPAAAPNAWVGLCVWGSFGFCRNSHFLLRRTVICCVCSSGFFSFSWSLTDSAVTCWTFWTGHYETKSFHFYASSSFVLVLFHCGLHSEETRRQRTCLFLIGRVPVEVLACVN